MKFHARRGPSDACERDSAPLVARRGGQGGLKKQSGKKKLAQQQHHPRPQAAKHPESSTDADHSSSFSRDPPPRPMELDAATTSAIKHEISERPRGTRPTPAGSCVVYLGHIPHGFYEEQMKGFFSQFGTVTRLRLARNKRTGRSKHYAFIEFKHGEVGEVVAKSMNGYLLFSKVLVAKVMRPEDVHPETFKDAGRTFRPVDRNAVVRQMHNRARTEKEAAIREQKLIRSDAAKKRKLIALGIEYDFDGYGASAVQSKKRKRGVSISRPAALGDVCDSEALSKATKDMSALQHKQRPTSTTKKMAPTDAASATISVRRGATYGIRRSGSDGEQDEVRRNRLEGKVSKASVKRKKGSF